MTLALRIYEWYYTSLEYNSEYEYPCPSYPLAPHPHVYIFPNPVLAITCLYPQATDVIFSPRFLSVSTRVG